MFSFSTMILECCCCCFASIFVASFVETIDALALPLFTHSFLFLSENALVVEKLVFVRVIECIFTAHKVRASNNNDSTVSSFLNFLFLKPKFFASLLSSIFFLSTDTPLFLSASHQNFSFCFCFTLPCFWVQKQLFLTLTSLVSFTSLSRLVVVIQKKRRHRKKKKERTSLGFPSHKLEQNAPHTHRRRRRRRRREKMASISASFVSVAPQKRAVNPSKTKCTSQTSVSSRAFSRGTSASFSGESVSCARLTQKMNGSNRGQRRVTTMAAKVAGYIKLAIEAGKANPAPPIGPALGAKVRFPSA